MRTEKIKKPTIKKIPNLVEPIHKTRLTKLKPDNVSLNDSSIRKNLRQTKYFNLIE